MTGRKRAVTKSGTGTWDGDVGRGRGTRDLGRGTRSRGTRGRGTRGRGTRGRGTRGRGTRGHAGTRGRNKQHLTFALNL